MMWRRHGDLMVPVREIYRPKSTCTLLADRVRNSAAGTKKSLYTALVDLSLTTNLVLCLDAGDANSYSSGQSWLDLAGSGYDFFFGDDGSVNASDPTFNGLAGGLSLNEYLSFDGSEYLTYDTSNETWMGGSTSGGVHHDNWQGTFFAIVDLPATPTGSICGTAGGSGSNIGFGYQFNSNAQYFLTVKGGAPNSFNAQADNALSAGVQMIAVSIDESGGSGFFWKNGAYDQVSASDTFAVSYTTPSSSAATYTMQIGAQGNASSPFESGSKLYALAAWSGAQISKANLDLIWDEMRGRFVL